MDLFGMERNYAARIGINFSLVFLVFLQPFLEILRCINRDTFPTGVAIRHNTCCSHSVPSGYIHCYIKCTKFTIELSFSMKRNIMPSIFIIHHHFWIPLCKIILSVNSSSSFKLFTHMMHPIEFYGKRFARRQ